MAKETISLTIEEKWFGVIDNYRDKNGLKSRSLALEWMLVEWEALKGFEKRSNQNQQVQPSRDTSQEVGSKMPPIPKEEKPWDAIYAANSDIFGEMMD